MEDTAQKSSLISGSLIMRAVEPAIGGKEAEDDVAGYVHDPHPAISELTGSHKHMPMYTHIHAFTDTNTHR